MRNAVQNTARTTKVPKALAARRLSEPGGSLRNKLLAVCRRKMRVHSSVKEAIGPTKDCGHRSPKGESIIFIFYSVTKFQICLEHFVCVGCVGVLVFVLKLLVEVLLSDVSCFMSDSNM